MNKQLRFIFSLFFLSLLTLAGGTVVMQTKVLAQQPVSCAVLGASGHYECFDSNDPEGPDYSFQDIAGNNSPLAFNNNDDGVVHVTMPFTFTFYNLASDKLTVSMNGAMKFGSHSSAINAFNTNLNVAPNYFIAPFWDDLDNSPGIGGGVYTDVIGSAPNRMFIVQWENIPHYNNTGASTFQAIFYEDTQEIRFQYEDVNYETSNFDWGASATIGIKGDGNYRQYSYNTAVIANQTAIRYLPTLIFPNDLPAQVTARSAISMTALAPDNAADGNTFVQTADGVSNETPFVTGDSFTPDAAGIGSSFAATASGVVATNTTWTENTLVTGDVTVNSGVTLTILPGVTIFFAANSDDQAGGIWTDKAEIQVHGALVAQGTITDPIYFTSNAPAPTPEDWGGIVIRNDSVSSSLDKCLIQYATYGVYFYNYKNGPGNVSGNISHCTFHNNTIGIRSLERPGTATGTLNTAPQILHNLFQNNTEYGVAFFLSNGGTVANVRNNAVVQDNSFRGNDVGLSINANSWGSDIRAFTEIRNNTFSNNTTHNVYIKGKRTGSRTVAVNPTIENNLFSNDVATNSNNIYLELEQYASVKPVIRYNTIANAAYGIHIHQTPVDNTAGAIDPDINHNIFYGFNEYAIFNATDRPISAEQNYWGSTEAEWFQGGSALVSGTGVITVANHLDFSSSPVLSRIEPGIAAAGDSLTLHGANFGQPTVDLALNKTVSPQSALPGDPVTYILRYSNQGTNLATGVVITDSIPAGITHSSLSYTHTGAVIAATGGAPYVWQVEDLAHNQGGVITISGVLSDELAAGSIANQATIAAAVRDSNANNNSGYAGITVQNVAPTANDDAPLAIDEDSGSHILEVLTNDSDNNGDALTISAIGTPDQGGTVLNAGTHIVYTPAADFAGTETFNYTVSDGNGGSDTAGVTVIVTNVNDAPGISDISNQATAAGTPVTVTFTISDIETNPDSLTLSGASSNAALLPEANIVFGGSGAARTAQLTPAAGVSGTVTVTFTVDDGELSAGNSFVLAVGVVNSPPEFSSDPVATVAVGAQYTYNIATTDSDTADTLSITAPAKPDWLTLTDNGNGTALLSGVPQDSDAGQHSVTLNVTDGTDNTLQTFEIAVKAAATTTAYTVYLPAVMK